jgi:hypothetical protein
MEKGVVVNLLDEEICHIGAMPDNCRPRSAASFEDAYRCYGPGGRACSRF